MSLTSIYYDKVIDINPNENESGESLLNDQSFKIGQYLLDRNSSIIAEGQCQPELGIVGGPVIKSNPTIYANHNMFIENALKGIDRKIINIPSYGFLDGDDAMVNENQGCGYNKHETNECLKNRLEGYEDYIKYDDVSIDHCGGDGNCQGVRLTDCSGTREENKATNQNNCSNCRVCLTNPPGSEVRKFDQMIEENVQSPNNYGSGKIDWSTNGVATGVKSNEHFSNELECNGRKECTFENVPGACDNNSNDQYARFEDSNEEYYRSNNKEWKNFNGSPCVTPKSN